MSSAPMPHCPPHPLLRLARRPTRGQGEWNPSCRACLPYCYREQGAAPATLATPLNATPLRPSVPAQSCLLKGKHENVPDIERDVAAFWIARVPARRKARSPGKYIRPVAGVVQLFHKTSETAIHSTFSKIVRRYIRMSCWRLVDF